MTEHSTYLDKPCRTITYWRALAHIRLDSAARTAGEVRDQRATRAWMGGREAGWTPAERLRRALANADQLWAA